MKVLVIDDSEAARSLLGAMLLRLGHEVTLEDGGKDGLQAFWRVRPDAVFVDILMRGLGGFEVAERIKAETAHHWIPVVFTSALGDSDHLSRAEDAGADGYLVKPIDFRLLRAKMRSLERDLALRRRIERQTTELHEYYIRAEDENRLALELMERRIDREALSDRRIRHWLSPAQRFSGDAIVAARAPDDVLNLMLADSTGHGLTSALAVGPVVSAFYAMTAKGFSVEAMVREINKWTKRYLTADRFVAAIVASINYKEGVMHVWNGGCPSCFALADDGSVLARFESRHPPLGVLPENEFDASQQMYGFDQHCQLVMTSDGLIEGPDGQGEMFGEARLMRSLVESDPRMRLSSLVNDYLGYLGNRSSNDDVSIVIADCQREDISSYHVSASRAGPATRASGPWSFSMRLSAEQIKTLDMVPLSLGIATQLGITEQQSGRIFMILSEIITNAVDHGLLRMDSTLKLQGIDEYLGERSRRLTQLCQGTIEIGLTRESEGDDVLVITCKDTGEGFDYHALADHSCGGSATPYGRGMALIRGLGATIEHRDSGNCVVVRLGLGEATGQVG